MHRLLILAGDGVGPEIMAEVRKVLQCLVAGGLEVEVDEELFGIAAWQAHGSLMREQTWEKVVAADAILFGAIGSPEYERIPEEARRVDQLLRMRRELDLYNNLRPIRLLPGMEDASTLRPEVVRGTDMVIVRELTGGLYFGEPRGIDERNGGRGFNTLVYTTAEVERIARAAFELARTRSGRVCNVDKSNVLETFAFWRRVLVAVHEREFPDVQLTHLYVDNCAMQLVRRPTQFDVIVTENLFGDILSDCAAMVTGSLGMLPSASLGALRADGRRHALYEPVHGSAPDIAGKGIANPCGAILSLAMCLRHSLHQPGLAERLEGAVEQAITAGVRTPDIAIAGQPTARTHELGDAIVRALGALS